MRQYKELLRTWHVSGVNSLGLPVLEFVVSAAGVDSAAVVGAVGVAVVGIR